MKKYILLFVTVAVVLSNAHAQLTQQTMGTKKEVKRIASPPPPPPAKSPVQQTLPPPPPPPPSFNNPVYSLSGVVVKVKTGNDNKENMSHVAMTLYNQSTNVVCFRPANSINVQFDSNSEMEFRLTRFSMQGMPDNSPSLLLNSIQSNGLRFELSYTPNFLFDAWKVQGITLVLEFKDQFGNPHPTLNNKVINMSNAVGLLDSKLKTMTCLIDKDLQALSARITN